MITYLKENNYIGKELNLKCKNHPEDQVNKIKSFEDFKSVPDGGCIKKCNIKLDCDHMC